MQEIIDYAEWLDSSTNCIVDGKYSIPVRCSKLCEEIGELKKVPQFSKDEFEDELGDVISTTALLLNVLCISYFPSVSEQKTLLDIQQELLKNIVTPALLGKSFDRKVAENAVYSMVMELRHFSGVFDFKKMIADKKVEFLIAVNS
jgi:NTP pyrophosphatase (non-canonical NTP hydrolase)